MLRAEIRPRTPALIFLRACLFVHERLPGTIRAGAAEFTKLRFGGALCRVYRLVPLTRLEKHGTVRAKGGIRHGEVPRLRA